MALKTPPRSRPVKRFAYGKSIKVSGGVVRPRGKRFVAEYSLLGKPKRKTFDTIDEGRQWIADCYMEIRRKGTDSLTLLEADQVKDAQKALILAEQRVSLQDAVSFWLEHNVQKNGTIGLNEYVSFYLKRMVEEEQSSAYQKQMKMRLAWLMEAFSGRQLQEITTEDLKARLDTRDVNLRTKRNITTQMKTFFNRAIEDGHLKLNPADTVLPPRRKPSRKQKINSQVVPEIFTVSEVKKLLAAAVEYRPDMVGPIALSFFAGIRSKEIARMRWEDIDYENNEILIRREVAKTGDHRHIKLSANLRSWLEVYGMSRGPVIDKPTSTVAVKAFDNARMRLTKKAGVTWKKNAGRHSFASYHYRFHGDEVDTYTQMGHDDKSMFREHYKGLVRHKSDAEAYWRIVPVPEENRILKLEIPS